MTNVKLRTQKKSAQGKKCLNCGLQSHLAKQCGQPTVQNPNNGTNKRINIVETEETPPSEDYQVNELYDNFNSDFVSSSDDNCVATIFSDSKILEPINQITTVGTAETIIMLNSSRVCTIINERLACRVAATGEFQCQICRAKARELRK